MSKFAKTLKELRREKNLTLIELASKADLSRSAIQQWENGLRVPNAIALCKLADFFEVSVDYLLGRIDQ